MMATHQTPEEFGKGMVKKAMSVTVDPVRRLYGPGGMIDKAAQKLVDKAEGKPDRDYVTEQEHQQMLGDIITVGGALFPGGGEVKIGIPGPPLVTADAAVVVPTQTLVTVPKVVRPAAVMMSSAAQSEQGQPAQGKKVDPPPKPEKKNAG